MKTILTAYFFMISTIGIYLLTYIFVDDSSILPFVMSIANIGLFHTYTLLWNKLVNKAIVTAEETEQKFQPMPVIGNKPVNYTEYQEDKYDLPDIGWDKPIKFDRSRAYYESKKPL